MNVVEFLAAVFPRVLELSLQAAVLALLVLIAQALLERKLPPVWRHGLWLLVVLRLIVPVSPESSLSLYNSLVRLSSHARRPRTGRRRAGPAIRG